MESLITAIPGWDGDADIRIQSRYHGYTSNIRAGLFCH